MLLREDSSMINREWQKRQEQFKIPYFKWKPDVWSMSVEQTYHSARKFTRRRGNKRVFRARLAFYVPHVRLIRGLREGSERVREASSFFPSSDSLSPLSETKSNSFLAILKIKEQSHNVRDIPEHFEFAWLDWEEWKDKRQKGTKNKTFASIFFLKPL